jgi:sugar (pentulose or hexulose) kinase
MSLHIAIDLGASTGRVIVGDEEIFDVTHRFPTRWVAAGGNMFWDILDIFREIKAGLFVAPGKPADKMTDRIKAFCGHHGVAVPTTHEEIMSTIVRSISAAYAEAIRHIEEASGVKIERVCVMGGGSRNRTLNRFTAQASGLPIVLGPSEATAPGEYHCPNRSDRRKLQAG